jgi:putative ABC transport system permease protein
MFGYYLRLASLALRRNKVLTLLMITAIGIGVGASMTTLTVFYAMSGNPFASKGDVLYVPQLDNWAPDQSINPDDPEQLPDLMTYRDAMALLKSGESKRTTVMMTNVFPLQPEDPRIAPFQGKARMTTADFFPMFDPPFAFGGGWDRAQDEAHAHVVVLDARTNQRLFGGADSAGRHLKIGTDDFTVVGVLGEWAPQPKAYDVTAGPYTEPEDIFMPLSYGIDKELQSTQNNSCWKGPTDSGYQAWLDSECIWLNVWVELDGRADRDRYRMFLDNYVNAQKKLGRFPRPTRTRLSSIDEWLDIEKVVRDDTRIQMALSFSFLAVCLINTIGLLLAKYMGRSGEIGLRRALGASKRSIFAQYLTEAGIVGLCGGVLGLALTLFGLQGMRVLDKALEHLARLDFTMVAAAIGLAVASALLAGLLPTWRACQIAPATQLKSQ